MNRLGKNTRVPVSFNEEEYRRIVEATQKSTVLELNHFVKILIHTGLNKIDIEGKYIIFKFDKEQKYKDLLRFKTFSVKITEEDYKKIAYIVEHTPFSTASLLKYLILPQVNEILKEGK